MTDDLFGDLPEHRRPRDPTRGALEAKRYGMDQVERAAKPEWKDLMLRLVRQTALAMRQFTSDDVFDLYEARGEVLTTHDLRAFGPIMLHAAKMGWCRKAQCAPVNSRRKSLHASPRSVWDSLLWRP